MATTQKDMKKNYFKLISSTFIVGAFLFLAFGSGESKSSSGSSNSSNSTVSHTCSTCGKKYEGEGWGYESDGVGGDLSLFQHDSKTVCKNCAQKGMDETKEARSHRGYQGNWYTETI